MGRQYLILCVNSTIIKTDTRRCEYGVSTKNRNRWQSGLSLVELVIALAILGIIAVAFLSMFSFAFTGIKDAGNRAVSDASAQTVVEDVLRQTFVDRTAIVTYLNGKGYHEVTTLNDLSTKIAGFTVNYHVGTEETIQSVPGYQFTVNVFSSIRNKDARITVFLVKGGL